MNDDRGFDYGMMTSQCNRPPTRYVIIGLLYAVQALGARCQVTGGCYPAERLVDVIVTIKGPRLSLRPYRGAPRRVSGLVRLPNAGLQNEGRLVSLILLAKFAWSSSRH